MLLAESGRVRAIANVAHEWEIVMNTQTNTNDTRNETSSDAEQIAGAFLRVGAAWARYGLGIARASVETSARTLDVTAGALGTLAKRFADLEEQKRAEDAPDAPIEPKHDS
ncbi:MAG: hypothetical protein IPI67_32960 [Myxococcales bacterium]|nr:hypothetical protein [Myxococcales bacterium]